MENAGNPWRREMKSFFWKFQCSKENSAQWITIFTLKHLCEGCCVENCCFTKLSCWGKRRTGICGNFSISKTKIPPILSIYCQKMPFWALLGYNIPTEHCLELFPCLVGLVFLGGFFNWEILFPCCTAAPVTAVSSPKYGKVKYSSLHRVAPLQLSRSEPEAALCNTFFPKICILRWCSWLHCWEKGICLGISGYEQEITWELPQGILITEAECCIHVCVIFIKISCSLE